MRQWLFGISVLCLSLSATTQNVSAQTPPMVKGATIELAQASPQDVKRAITQFYQEMDDALNQRDVKRLGSFLAPEYTVTGVDKTVKNRQQFLQTTVENLQLVQQLKIQTQLKQIKVDGKTATVIGVAAFRGIIADPSNAQASRAVVGEQSFQDVLQLVGPEWKLVTTMTRSENWQAEPQPNQPTKTSNHDTRKAFTLGKSAINGCYNEHNKSRLEDCNELRQIQSTLSQWCFDDSDREACSTLRSLQSLESLARSALLK
jgi:ketosteroid isomerase-like protein